ncbi:MAG: carboxyl transferase domain-containing protein, partial [Acutalibacteraceae bacterium]
SCSDAVIALDGAEISPIAPDAAVMILFDDRLKNGESREELKTEYLRQEASSYAAAAAGTVDKIVSSGELRETLVSFINTLCGKRETTLSKKHSNMPL